MLKFSGSGLESVIILYCLVLKIKWINLVSLVSVLERSIDKIVVNFWLILVYELVFLLSLFILIL